MDSLANRRKHPRIPFDTELRVRVGGKDFQPLRCTNISMGGMCLHITEQIKKGSKGKLWLTQAYSSGGVISFQAQFKVLWVEPIPPSSVELSMGIEFLKMKRRHQDSLLEILRRQGTLGPA